MPQKQLTAEEQSYLPNQLPYNVPYSHPQPGNALYTIIGGNVNSYDYTKDGPSLHSQHSNRPQICDPYVDMFHPQVERDPVDSCYAPDLPSPPDIYGREEISRARGHLAHTHHRDEESTCSGNITGIAHDTAAIDGSLENKTLLSKDTVTMVCTLRDGPSQSQCNAILSYQDWDRRALMDHIRRQHGIVDLKRLAQAHVVCPDNSCLCRFKNKTCVTRDQNGRAIPHPTHVVDYLRHYMDNHLEPQANNSAPRHSCPSCGRPFTRHGSLIRHQQRGTRGCPRS